MPIGWPIGALIRTNKNRSVQLYLETIVRDAVLIATISGAGTAATFAGDLGFDDAWIAKCLDHAGSKKQEQIVPTVTGKVYSHGDRMKKSGPCWTASRPSCGGSSASP